MGALTIAFDITIVGALALPWVLLVVHLFFFEGENHLGDVLNWVKQQEMQAVAGILLFAAAYTLGSAVSRIAQDFFNDDDLYFHVHFQGGLHLFRVGVTEDRILSSVYCKMGDGHKPLLRAGKENPALESTITDFQQQKGSCSFDDAEPGDTQAQGTKAPTAQSEAVFGVPKPPCLCEQTLWWYVRPDVSSEDDKLNETAADIFSLQESALLLKGDDYTLRLRQLHDQLMVLRGAAFNGMVAFSFCLFAWGGGLRREESRSIWRWLIAWFPVVVLILAGNALRHHLAEKPLSDPPYMEFSLGLIGLAGVWLLWLRRRESAAFSQKPAAPRWRWPGLALLSAVLAFSACLGWWATEVAYAQQLIYSYDAQGVTAGQR